MCGFGDYSPERAVGLTGKPGKAGARHDLVLTPRVPVGNQA